MRVPVLTYHANNVLGNEYDDNDHVALAEDLILLRRLGRRIVPLHTIVETLIRREGELDRCVALSFDDGSWFDWHDLEHPRFGRQRSFANVLRDFCARAGDAATAAPATSFVIASPDARAVLDRTCLLGRGWWTDAWWPSAAADGLLAIESHSWDHNHADLPPAPRQRPRGTFTTIDNYADADAQVRQASEYLDRLCHSRRTSLFAYPYGENNDYLAREYLPDFVHEHRLRAAFTTEPGPITGASDRWLLPRYVCGHHWKSPGELEAILRSLAA